MSEAIHAVDRQMEHVLESSIASLPDAEVSDEERVQARNSLLAAQEAWKQYREASCNAALRSLDNGGAGQLEYLDCMRRLAERRLHDFTVFPTDVARTPSQNGAPDQNGRDRCQPTISMPTAANPATTNTFRSRTALVLAGAALGAVLFNTPRLFSPAVAGVVQAGGAESSRVATLEAQLAVAQRELQLEDQAVAAAGDALTDADRASDRVAAGVEALGTAAGARRLARVLSALRDASVDLQNALQTADDALGNNVVGPDDDGSAEPDGPTPI